VPIKHVATLSDLQKEDHDLIGAIHGVANRLAEKEGVAKDGYRVVVNCGAKAGQTVFHIHFHLLGGRHFSWPPG
jgi:histidine triad (HIT) family protein